MHAHSDCGCGHKHASRQHGCSISARPALGKISTLSPLSTDAADAPCCGDSSAGSGDTADDDSDRRDSPAQLRWLISGMDCPACARKVEAAARQVAGVHTARVLFSTQKLLVAASPAVTARVEQAVADAGFQLTSEHTPASPAPTVPFWRENGLIVVLLLLTAASWLLAQFSPLAGTLAFTLTTLVGVYPVARSAWRSLRNGQPFTIETLMSIAAIGALFIGATAEAAMVLLLFMVGERLESFAAGRARKGVSALIALKPETAVRLVNGTRETVALADLRPGDTLTVPPGGRLPADGTLLTPRASFDESALTGESMPVEHQAGDALMAGALSVDAQVELRVSSQPGESAIDRILQLIEDAESHRAPVERFIDRFSRIYTPVIMLLALLVALLPPLLMAGQPWHEWLYKGLTLLLIGCPCALVISTPAAITSALATASRQGVLIKGGAALEQLSRIRTLAFDKTGTLTAGQPAISEILPFHAQQADALLTLAAAVEQGSSHPLAQAIVREAAARKLVVPQAREQRALAGQGVEAWLGDDRLALRAPGTLPTESLSEQRWQQIRQREQAGNTVVILLRNDRAEGLLALRDRLRENAREALASLRDLGITSVMLTGDNPRTAAAIATELGIDWRAGLLPADKVSEVQRLNQQAPLAMVGDGINDAPAMKAASLGIAMGSGSDVALETADAALTHNRLGALAQTLRLARAARLNVRQNIGIALGLKGIFLVTTLLGFTGLWLAVLADSGATALVTLNALRLLKMRK